MFSRKAIIFTNKARCRDCYRCLRNCPVNAIKLIEGQASVDAEKCILCGTCLKECPQEAKAFRRDVEKVKKIISENENVAVSIAPSFPAMFENWQVDRIPSILRKLGFTYISETSEAAYFVAEETEKYFNDSQDGLCISSACPSLVNYIEKYDPENVKNLVPVVSPMIAHAKRLKAKLGYSTKIVFIGPCLAKKKEAEREEYGETVSAVLTFTELLEWIEEENIEFKTLEESEFDEKVKEDSRLFPLCGGMSKTASMNPDNLNNSVFSVSGVNEIIDSLNSFRGTGDKILLEPLACRTGCINGAGISSKKNIYLRKQAVINYAAMKNNFDETDQTVGVDLTTYFKKDSAVEKKNFTDAQIRVILEKTGKQNEEDRLNCGACGYSTCVENAKAILNGMAEIEMCIPFMRKLAEQRTDKIIESSPNGIVIINDELEILHMNPAFKKFFMCSYSAVGKRISSLMDPEPFVELIKGTKEKIELIKKHKDYFITCHQILYKLPEEKQYAGIFVNITKNLEDVEKLDTLREDTILKARELFDNQINAAQQLAKLLGESTAKGEELVESLIKLVEDEKILKTERKKNWLWDIYTPKS